MPATILLGSATPATEMLIPAETIVSAPSIPWFAYQNGHQSDSYLASAPGREIFWSKGYGGLISYLRLGRHVLVSGGLIAPPSERPRLLDEFLKFTSARKWRSTFFCIPEEDVPLFRDAGYAINKMGEEAAIDLRSVSFAGKSYEWVRRQSNYCVRHGVSFEELRPQDYSLGQWSDIEQELYEVQCDGLRQKPQTAELRFFDGSLGEHQLGYRRLFVARTQQSDQSRIEGYVVCNPINHGRAWSTEIYRHRADAVRGTISFLFHRIALHLKEENVEQLNLCIALARNCDQPIPGEKSLIRRSLMLFRRHGSVLFDLKGIDHFKSRFRPRYENLYLCSPRDPSIGAMLATVRALGLLRVSPLKLLRLIWQRAGKKRTHTLSFDHGD